MIIRLRRQHKVVGCLGSLAIVAEKPKPKNMLKDRMGKPNASEDQRYIEIHGFDVKMESFVFVLRKKKTRRGIRAPPIKISATTPGREWRSEEHTSELQ